MDDLRVLTMTSFGETAEDNARITLNSMEIIMTSAREEIRQGVPAMRVAVMFKDGGQVEVFVSSYDLLQIEKAIGTFGFMDMCE